MKITKKNINLRLSEFIDFCEKDDFIQNYIPALYIDDPKDENLEQLRCFFDNLAWLHDDNSHYEEDKAYLLSCFKDSKIFESLNHYEPFESWRKEFTLYVQTK